MNSDSLVSWMRLNRPPVENLIVWTAVFSLNRHSSGVRRHHPTRSQTAFCFCRGYCPKNNHHYQEGLWGFFCTSGSAVCCIMCTSKFSEMKLPQWTASSDDNSTPQWFFQNKSLWNNFTAIFCLNRLQKRVNLAFYQFWFFYICIHLLSEMLLAAEWILLFWSLHPRRTEEPMMWWAQNTWEETWTTPGLQLRSPSWVPRYTLHLGFLFVPFSLLPLFLQC